MTTTDTVVAPTGIHLYLAALLVLWLLVPQPATAGQTAGDLIGERLSLMRDVAAWKRVHNLPIEDHPREALVVRRAVLGGLSHNITRGSSQRFFEAQIAAAKAIQHCWFERWQAGEPPPGEIPDLVQVTRPALLRLGEQIMVAVGALARENSRAQTLPVVDCLPAANADAIQEALTGISRYPDQLTQVQESRILRVGTTGDYAPFSFADPATGGTQLVGIDIELAHELAATLGAEVQLVPTSWPGLMNDLAAGRYDIAMSGVSITGARASHAYFSAPYHVGGKTPVARCERAAAFASPAGFDQPGVRIIVNPGGTNEKYVDANIRHATKILHPDNRTIFEEIIAGRADLMITDAIEVQLKSAQHPELCATMPGTTLNRQEKGYMMPRDESLRSAVNTWLEAMRANGRLDAAFRRYQVTRLDHQQSGGFPRP